MIFLESCQKRAKLAQSNISTYASSVFLQTETLDILPKQNLRWNTVSLNSNSSSREYILSVEQSQFEMNYGQSLSELIV